MPERHLKIGAWVKTRLVPSYAVFQVGADIPTPTPPKVGYKSAAGHTEYKDAPQDSPEFQKWAAEVGDIGRRITALKDSFTYGYAIESWSWDEGATWQTEPPDEWQFPKQLEDFGIHPGPSRRSDYVRYELLKINDDIGVVLDDALGRTARITDAEVQAALGGFRGNVSRSGSTRKRRKAKG